MTRVERVAERVAGNVMLTAASRLIMAMGVPTVLMVGAWVARDLVGLERRMTVIEQSRPDVLRRIEAVERQNQRGAEEAARMAARFATIEAQLATLVAQQAATLRGLERVERVLDSDRPPAAGRP